MVKSQVCESEKTFLKKRTWSPEEDQKLIAYIKRYRIWNWTEMAKAAGLFRSGKSCRLRWMNYLRPGIKHGNFSQEEDQIIIKLHEELGPRWSTIAARLPGRTDNEIKNYWNSRLKKRLQNNLMPTSSQETPTATIDADLHGSPKSKVDFLFPNATKSSNSYGCKATPMSPTKSSSHEFSSSSPNPSGEFYVNQTMVEKFGLSEQYGKLQCLLEQTFQTEGVDMVEVYGASTDPGFLVPTFHWDFTDEESQSLEQPFPMEGLNMVQGYEDARGPGFLVTFHGGFADEELQSSLEQPFSVEGLDMVQDYAATTDSGFQVPTFHGCFADESLKQPFPMEDLDKVDVYGSTNPEFMVSTSKGKVTDEELRRLLEEPFQMEGIEMVEGFGTRDPGFTVSTSQRAFSDEEFITLDKAEGYEATTNPGFDISTWQWGPQEDTYPCASYHLWQ